MYEFNYVRNLTDEITEVLHLGCREHVNEVYAFLCDNHPNKEYLLVRMEIFCSDNTSDKPCINVTIMDRS